MKRASRKPSDLSESLHQRLNSYALAASAAGVSALALAQPAEAKIVYTKASIEIAPGNTLSLDLNHSRKTEFSFSNHTSTTRSVHSTLFRDNFGVSPQGGNGVLNHASVLGSGVQIGPKGQFQSSTQRLVYFQQLCLTEFGTCRSSTVGNWKNVARGYLGLKFFIQGKAHYGWARFNVTVTHKGIYALLTGYAYETIADKPIITGKTKGPDVITIQDASLGHLARGASGLSAWRKAGGDQ